MRYILETTTEAKFDNLEDATTYFHQMEDDEPDAQVREPRRSPSEGLYVVSVFKDEIVHVMSTADGRRVAPLLGNERCEF